MFTIALTFSSSSLIGLTKMLSQFLFEEKEYKTIIVLVIITINKAMDIVIIINGPVNCESVRLGDFTRVN